MRGVATQSYKYTRALNYVDPSESTGAFGFRLQTVQVAQACHGRGGYWLQLPILQVCSIFCTPTPFSESGLYAVRWKWASYRSVWTPLDARTRMCMGLDNMTVSSVSGAIRLPISTSTPYSHSIDSTSMYMSKRVKADKILPSEAIV